MAIGRWISTAVTKSISLPNLRVLRDFVVVRYFSKKSAKRTKFTDTKVIF